MLRTCHDEVGHCGKDKTIDLLKKTYWFPDMHKFVNEYIQSCLKCICYNSISGKQEGRLHSIPKGDSPFETIHIDHMGPLDRTKKRNKHILVVVDAFSRFVKLYPVNSTTTSLVIECLETYFRQYSRPVHIISDRGSCFTSDDFKEFCTLNNIRHTLIATASPQANGAVERINRSIRPMLAKLTDKKFEWDSNIVKVEFALNNTKNRSIGETPARMLFGTSQKGEIVNELKEFLESEIPEPKRNLIEIRQKAKIQNDKTQNYNQHQYNLRHKTPLKYSVNDLIMVKNFDTTPGKIKKLVPKYKGPYVVKKILGNDRYLITDSENNQITSRPYEGVFSSQNMKKYLNINSSNNN